MSKIVKINATEMKAKSNLALNLELKVVPVVQVLICMLLITCSYYLLPTLNYSFKYSNTLSLVILVMAVFIVGIAIINFKQSKTTVNPTKPEQASKVVNTGIYHYSRNPMYLAMLLVLLAFCLYFENVVGFFTLPLFVWYIGKFQIIPEEKILTALFGKPYDEYVKSVRRWL